MTGGIKQTLKNVFYSVSANVLSLAMSLLSFLFIPKLLPVADYGAWQLYMFYLSFVGFFHFGWIDGIYLRYGGFDYERLDKKVMAGQYYALALMELIIAITIFAMSDILANNEFVINALRMVSIVGIFIILTTFTNFILQFTNRIKDYAKLITYERVLFFILSMSYVLFGFKSYVGLLYISFITRLFGLCFSIYLIREIVIVKIPSIKSILQEAWINISVGSKLMLANIAGILLIGIIRLGISQGWDIVTFGKVSLTLNVSNFIMSFIAAVSVVMFPILKRIDQDKLPSIYSLLRMGLSIALLGMLIFYYPLKSILLLWLPQYADGLKYMAILFPICLFESKMSLLINTYLKSLREEKLMLKINWIAVLISLVLTYITVFLLHDLNLAVLSIVLVFAFRCVLAEYFMSILLKLNLLKDILLEIGLVCVFILTSWFIDSWWCMVIYGLVYAGYLGLKKDDVINAVKMIKKSL